ncbi:MAG: hypothetical protein EBQ48_00595 [Betaproteobacteria bacterium]|nr:hypothetical protein [Betaproteobacteria bacterium]
MRSTRWPGRANVYVSLLSIAKGEASYGKYLDGRAVQYISPLLEDDKDLVTPCVLDAQADRGYIGSVLYGDSFFVPNDFRVRMISINPRNQDVVLPVINGDDANSSPEQSASRSVICFRDFDIGRAQSYVEPFQYADEFIRTERERYASKPGSANKRLAERWWLFGRYSTKMYASIVQKERCFAAAITTKYVVFSEFSTGQVFLNTLFIVDSDRWEHFAILQSTHHEVWARKYSGAVATTLRYSPSDCFETFAFPGDLWETRGSALAQIGEQYHQHRRSLMRGLCLGVTDIYNLFHTRDLSSGLVAKVSKKPADIARAGFDGLLELRRLHVALDNAVRDAYGWSDLNLGHDFVEVETLPENDRVRYTISPAARKEVLKRLLALNLQRAKEEAAKTPAAKAKGGKKTTAKVDPNQPDLI